MLVNRSLLLYCHLLHHYLPIQSPLSFPKAPVHGMAQCPGVNTAQPSRGILLPQELGNEPGDPGSHNLRKNV